MASKITFNKVKSLTDDLFSLQEKGICLENDPNGEYKGKLKKLEELKSQLTRRQVKLLE